MDYYKLLAANANDSQLNIVEYTSKALLISCAIDALGGEKHAIRIPYPIHLDMPPVVVLGKALFGGQELLPMDYMRTRNKGYEGDEEGWRVLKIIDDEENNFYVIFIEQEAFSKGNG